MKLEVNSAADFLMNLLRLKKGEPLPNNDQLQSFKGSLESLLVLHYRSHWYPEIPTKGSGYRCIRINGKIDPLIAQAGIAVGIAPNVLRKMLPAELTLWIDPEEVAYRIGENGSICVLYDSQSRASPSSDLDSTASSADEFIMDRVGRPDLSIDYNERHTSSLSPSNSPTKPVPMQEMVPDPRRMNYVPQNQLPPSYQMHPQPPHPQAFQYHRQAINANHNHHPSTQHQQYMQQVQWDGFGNNNKVSFQKLFDNNTTTNLRRKKKEEEEAETLSVILFLIFRRLVNISTENILNECGKCFSLSVYSYLIHTVLYDSFFSLWILWVLKTKMASKPVSMKPFLVTTHQQLGLYFGYF